MLEYFGAPALDGELLVWTYGISEEFDIFALDISTKGVTTVCASAGDQAYADVNGNTSVWADNRFGTWDIYIGIID